MVIASYLLLIVLISCGEATTNHSNQQQECEVSIDRENVILIKVGGSSITDKAKRETLNPDALKWLSETLAAAMESSSAPTGQQDCRRHKKSFVIVHGAGSFGHHTAKEFGLSGQSLPPSNDYAGGNQTMLMEGLAKTRLSVQSLNQEVISSLIQHGIPAVGISPCFGIPGLQAHGGDHLRDLVTIVNDCIQAGLVPVLHGDACLYGSFGAGILGGDTIMEALGTSGIAQEAIFVTDVDGVFTADPRVDPQAQLLQTIDIDAETGKVLTSLEASASSHSHDVTGGLEVSDAVFSLLI
jgi:isopentenyl phosphate kinase